MTARLIVLILICLSAQLQSQLNISKMYPAPRKSVPLEILNNSAHHFYILRYNKMAHDITIERRRKSDAGIAAFTPLKLDSVNASWFNYEYLDYLFFEKDRRLFFVFERVLNKESRIFMKEIDTLGRSSGFIELASLRAGKNESRLSMQFELTEAKMLQVTRTRAFGAIVHRDISVIDPGTRAVVFESRLPVENPSTGYSDKVLTDSHYNIYYQLAHFHFELQGNYGGPFGGYMNVRPLVDSLQLVVIRSAEGSCFKKSLPLQGISRLNSASLQLTSNGVDLHLLFAGNDSTASSNLFFAHSRYNHSLDLIDSQVQELDPLLSSQLTFYDGSNEDSPALKNYHHLTTLSAGAGRFHFTERRDENYYKEMLVWRTSDKSCGVTMQCIIPRKIFFFEDRAAFRTIGKAMHTSHQNRLYTFLLEHRSNSRDKADQFDFHSFRRQETHKGANLAAYILHEGGGLQKKIVYENRDFFCVPLKYSGNTDDVVLYLTKNEVEKFAIVRLNQL